MRRLGRHLQRPTTKQRNLGEWGGTLPWGFTGFAPGASQHFGTSAHPYATDPDAQDDEPDDGEISPDEIAADLKGLLPKFDDLMIPYSMDDILTDGCFLAREKLEKSHRARERLLEGF